MTAKQFIEILNNIKTYCRHRDCYDCIFDFSKTSDNCCQIMLLAKEMTGTPSRWDMEEIERLVKDESNINN